MNQAKRTESETFVSRRATEEIGKDQAVLIGEAKNGDAFQHWENVLHDLG